MERLLDLLANLFAPLTAAWEQEFGRRATTPALVPPPAPSTAPAVPTVEDAKEVVPSEVPATLPPLFVRKGVGRGARYLPADPGEPGTRYRRLVAGKRAKYEPVI